MQPRAACTVLRQPDETYRYTECIVPYYETRQNKSQSKLLASS